MWIKTQSGKLVNSDYIARIEKAMEGIPKKAKYEVMALQEDGICLAILARDLDKYGAKILLDELYIAFEEKESVFDVEEALQRWKEGLQELASIGEVEFFTEEMEREITKASKKEK